MGTLEKRATKALVQSNSVSGAAGKGMVAVGSTAIALSVLAAVLPFVGVLGIGVVLIVLGALMWE